MQAQTIGKMANDIVSVNEVQGEVIFYQPDNTMRLEVRLEDETVWLTQQQMVTLFQSSKANVSEHIRNIYDQGELEQEATVRNFRTVRKEGNRMVNRTLTYYNLDAIISVGFRVNTKRGIMFRQWANRTLKEYLLRGYAFHQQMIAMQRQIDVRLEEQNERLSAVENHLHEHDQKFDMIVKTPELPNEGVFFDGQIFDAFKLVMQLIKSAEHRIILIDNYINEEILTMFDQRANGVTACIYTARIDSAMQLAIQRHDAQYDPIPVNVFRMSHDRWLIIDDKVYHFGASLKDLGKKWFGVSLYQDITPEELLSKIS
ncbi:Virulence protein RhuM family protein [Prevotella sp. tc2-28]|nr:Virulence protein RhuM family protein [Prevotella sp. tc2-28]